MTRKASRNDRISATPLFAVWHLSTNDGADLGGTQATAAPNPVLLYGPWGRHDDDPVGVAVPSCFEQQRNIQYSQRLSS